MNPIEELINEHEAVRLSLRVLGNIAEDIGKSKRIVHKDDLSAILDFFRVFVDRCHHGKEERLLFPALEALGVGHDGGPIGVMLSEHEKGRQYVAEMAAAITQARSETAAGASRFVKGARGFIDLLERHIQKENQVLFPLGEKNLSEEEKTRLKTGFDKIEEEEVGPGRHEAFHELLDRLQSEYLGRN